MPKEELRDDYMYQFDDPEYVESLKEDGHELSTNPSDSELEDYRKEKTDFLETSNKVLQEKGEDPYAKNVAKRQAEYDVLYNGEGQKGLVIGAGVGAVLGHVAEKGLRSFIRHTC